MSTETQQSFAIGIDLGTTNCTLASTSLSTEQPSPETFLIPQVISVGEVAAEQLLPSFLYLSENAEFPSGALDLPWQPGARTVVGIFARERGASTPARLISSGKSWLSYAGVDRRANILPWGAPEGVPKVSPLNASARYLNHLSEAWDHHHPDAPMANQDVVLTVPASFDAVARELTLEAARAAGLENSLRLLEEPQAALYAWIAECGSEWRKQLSIGDTILVCDIGGGTTDLSLIQVCEVDGSLELERIAVGDHILLGGDNMDLALAYRVHANLEQEQIHLDDWQMRALTYSCRMAKEALLSDANSESHPLVIPGRGSQLIGGTIRTSLSRAELETTLLQGFFPLVSATDRPQTPRRVGLTSLGLPYASDAAITRHLAAFLGRTSLERPTEHSLLHPSAILFNGGVTKSPVIQQRICELLQRWAQADGCPGPRILEGTNMDLAVSRGAAYYAYMLRKGGVRIRGGTARSYYVGVERAGLAVPGIPPTIDAFCIAPLGMEEGSEVELPELFGLYVGEPASFRFFCSSTRRGEDVGTIAPPAELTELAPIETILEGEAGKLVTVRLQARVTETGQLELSAVDINSGQPWKLSFNVRVE